MRKATSVAVSFFALTAAIFVLGALTCRLGSPGKDAATRFLAALGVLAHTFIAVERVVSNQERAGADVLDTF